jgi:hypothetical protein
MKLKIMTLLTIIFINSCGLNSKKVMNSGESIVENGRGLPDTITYNCIGCQENLTYEMFELVKVEGSNITKNNLKIPLSFIPISMDIIIIKEDSLFDVSTNKKIDSVLNVTIVYKYIGQNSFGTEMNGDQLVSFTLVKGVVKDISGDIKLKDLKFIGGDINRSLFCSDSYNNSYIKLIPTKDKQFIVTSDIKCVDEDAWLVIKLVNGEEITLISWNRFNCEGILIFNWFSPEQIDKLKKYEIEVISILDRKSTMVLVSKNNRDYFKQLIKLF